MREAFTASSKVVDGKLVVHYVSLCIVNTHRDSGRRNGVALSGTEIIDNSFLALSLR